MARQQPGKNSSKTTPAPEASTDLVEPTTEQEGTTVTESVTPESAESAETTAPESTEEAVIDTTAFGEAVEEARSGKNTETGEPTAEGLEKVVAAYQDLPGAKGKSAARSLIQDRQDAAIEAMEVFDARFYMNLSKSLVAAKGASKPRAERKPVDNTEAFAEATATLDLARALAIKPENVDDEAAQAKRDEVYNANYQAVKDFLAWQDADKETRGDEPEVSKLVKTAARLARGSYKSGTTSTGERKVHTGPRKSPAKHIAAVFADVASGTFITIGDIVKAESDEYGSGEVSPGAVSNALRDGKVEGVSLSKPDGKPAGGLKA